MKKTISFLTIYAILSGLMYFVGAAEENAIIGKEGGVIEYEVYNHLFNMPGTICDQTNANGNLASGGAYIYWDTNSRTEDIFSDIPVTVTDSGLYEITVTASRISCYPQIFMDGKSVLEGKNASHTLLDETAEDGTPLYFKKKPFHAYAHTTMMYLTAGDHTIRTNINRRELKENGVMVTDVASCIDNITFSYRDALDIQTKSVSLEYEKFYGIFSEKPDVYHLANMPKNLASGGGYIHWDTNSSAEDISGDIPIRLEKGAYYDASLICSHVCAVDILLDGASVLGTKAAAFEALDEVGEDGVYPYFVNKYHSARRYTRRVYIPRGRHILSTVARRRTIGSTQDVAVCLDNITFERVDAPAVSVGKSGAVQKEFEDYIDYVIKDDITPYKGTVGEYEKGTVLKLTEFPAEDGITLDVPIVVAENGWYELQSILSRQITGWTSVVTLSIDGKMVLQNNDEHSIEDLSYTGNKDNIDFISSSYPMHRFRGICYLEKGEHMMQYYAKRRTDQTVYDASHGIYRVCTVADQFTFLPLEDVAEIVENKVSVEAYYSEELSGVAMVALYADGNLVGLEFQNASGSWILQADVKFTEHPDTVKILVWNNFLDMDPVTKVKEIRIK